MSYSKKYKKYLQKYKEEWERDSVFRGWIEKCQNPYEARCKVCNRVINIKHGKQDLRRHANSEKHQKTLMNYLINDQEQDNNEPEEVSTLDDNSELWGFYDKEPRNRAKCSMCGVNLACDQDIMYQHLKDVHSNVSKHLQCNDQDGSYTEVIYLEDPEIEKPEKKRKRREKSEEFSRVQSEGSLDEFGRYITSLLKGVPVDVSMQLQADIVSMVMKAKGDCAEEVNMETEEIMEQTEEQCMKFEDPIPIERKRMKAPDKPEKPKMLYENGSTENDEHITNFGRYLTSLMKYLNKHTTLEIQSDIVNLIVGAKLKCIRATRNSFTEIQNKVLIEGVA